MKKRLCVVITLVFVLQMFLSTAIFAVENSPTIKLNGSEPEKVGDWLYFVKSSYNYSLFKIGPKNSEKEIAKQYAGYAVAMGDRIYYPNPEDENRIYSVKQDGTDNKLFFKEPINLISGVKKLLYAKYPGGSSVTIDVTSGKVTEILSKQYDIYNASQKWMYYKDEKNLYKSALDGSGAVVLTAFDGAERFICQMEGDTFYYVYKDKLYRSDPENKHPKKIADSPIYNLLIRGKLIFFKDPKNNYIYKMTTDGKEKKLLVKDDVWFSSSFDSNLYLNGTNNSYKISADGKKITKYKNGKNIHFGTSYGIYFVKANEKEGLEKMRADGSEETMLLKEKMYSAQMKDGKVYYTNDNGLFMANLDGTEKKQIFNGFVYDFSVKDSWIYLYSDGSIYNLTLDGKENSRTKVGSYLNYLGEDVYFQGYETNALYKVPISGGTPVVIDGNSCSDVSVDGGVLYYVADGKLMKVVPGATAGKLVAEVSGYGGVTGDFIRYYNNDLNAAYVMRLDGTGKTEYKYNENYITIIDGWEYYVNPDDQNFLYKKQLDGSKAQLVLDEADVRNMNIRDGILFAQKAGDQIILKMKDGTKKTVTLKDGNIFTMKLMDGYLYYQIFRFDSVDNKIYKMN